MQNVELVRSCWFVPSLIRNGKRGAAVQFARYSPVATNMASTHSDISPPQTKRRRLEPKADTNHDSKPSNDVLSIYSWNVNGIQPFLQQSIKSFFTKPSKASKPTSTNSEEDIPAASLRDFLRRQKWPTVLCLQEVKINPSDTTTIRAVERAVKRPSSATATSAPSASDSAHNEPDYRAFFTLPSDPHNARGFGRKIYGVCTIVRTDFLESKRAVHRTVDWDLEGRISIIETAATPPTHSSDPSESVAINPLPRLSIWNIYAVNGTSNPYKSPLTGQVTGTRHNRKRAFHAHLLAEILRLEREGFVVILAGDMNIARDERDGFPGLRTSPHEHVVNRADFNDKFFAKGGGVRGGDDKGGFEGVDTFREVRGEERGYTYYPRGRKWGESCDRVDLIICSEMLKRKLVDAGILETPADRGTSDHCPLYATFELSKDR